MKACRRHFHTTFKHPLLIRVLRIRPRKKLHRVLSDVWGDAGNLLVIDVLSLRALHSVSISDPDIPAGAVLQPEIFPRSLQPHRRGTNQVGSGESLLWALLDAPQSNVAGSHPKDSLCCRPFRPAK
jgi:hypothetical protein